MVARGGRCGRDTEDPFDIFIYIPGKTHHGIGVKLLVFAETTIITPIYIYIDPLRPMPRVRVYRVQGGQCGAVSTCGVETIEKKKHTV